MKEQADIVKQKREVFLACTEKGRLLIKKGTDFRKEKTVEDIAAEAFTAEYSKNARYLHRGYYCPSMVRDVLIGNSRRGTIVKRPKQMANITHKYLFSQDGKLRKAVSFIPSDNNTKTEYLIYEENVVYGLAYDDADNLVGLSEEVFADGNVVSYFCASCFVQPNSGMDFGITEMFYEAYHYVEQKLHSMKFFHVCPHIDDPDDDAEVDTLIGMTDYQFIRENGCIVGFEEQNSFDGTHCVYDYPNIKGKPLTSPNIPTN